MQEYSGDESVDVRWDQIAQYNKLLKNYKSDANV